MLFNLIIQEQVRNMVILDLDLPLQINYVINMEENLKLQIVFMEERLFVLCFLLYRTRDKITEKWGIMHK